MTAFAKSFGGNETRTPPIKDRGSGVRETFCSQDPLVEGYFRTREAAMAALANLAG